MTIQKYEDWMRSQVVALFNLEYQTELSEFDNLFGTFYEHPFQREKCIRIVALDGDRVAGFQSFFYWPVRQNGQLVKSYQSGNSLVHPDFRGRGLFAKMLNFIHDEQNGFQCDLLIGFPVEASYNSFIRNKWLNPFHLQWYVKPLHPIRSLLSTPESQLRKALGNREMMDFKSDSTVVHIDQTKQFDDYRFGYEKGDFYRFVWRSGEKEAFFEMKAQRRKKVIRELVIGKFLTSHHEEKFVREAFAQLLKKVKEHSNFTLISCAINEKDTLLSEAMEAFGFRKIDKKIYFIAKGSVAEKITDWSPWWIFRSDIDTW